jgi:carboxypeptidase Q
MKSFLAFALLLVFSVACVAQGDHPSTKEERERAIALASKLEANPLDDSLRSDREWLLKWAAEASDFTVSMCASHGEFAKKKYKYGPELTFQKMASAIAFVLQHPDQQKDPVAQELAGVNGTLNAYEVIVKTDPKGHTEYWDDLLKKRSDGTLKDFVSDYVNKECSGRK